MGFKPKNRNTFLVVNVLAIVIGVVAGAVSVFFKWLIVFTTTIFCLIPQTIGLWGWVIAPAIGGLMVAIVVNKSSQDAKGHGVPEVINAYATNGGKIRFRVTVSKIIASALCIGSGGSSGREGPIAQIGGGVASSLAMYFKLNKRMTKTLVVCGVSAGIAATFNAPLGGTLFGIEVIAGGFIGYSIIPIILSSVIATSVSVAILGTNVSFQAPPFVLNNFMELVFYLFLGISLGLVSVLWNRGFHAIEDVIERLRASKYLLPAIGGLAVGIIGVFAIYIENTLGYSGLFAPGEPYVPVVMGGVGYSFMDAALIGEVALGLLLIFAILKALTTSLTLGSGGSGGVLAPTLFIGTALGGAFGIFFAGIFPTIIITPMSFALVGMAALFAGSGRTPITCIVMTMELTGGYSLILPLMIAVSMSYVVASAIEKEGMYTLTLSRKGVKIPRSHYVGALKAVNAHDVMVTNPITIHPTMTIKDMIKIVDQTQYTCFPVVNARDQVIGTITTESIVIHLESGYRFRVFDMMEMDFIQLDINCSMDTILKTMLQHDRSHAVVVDPPNSMKMVGFITMTDVMKAYEVAIRSLRDEGEDIAEITSLEASHI